MHICEESHVTAVMVTHDVDEALLLSDRVVMLTNGPESHIGQILTVDLPRPRHRMEVVKHRDYYHMRSEIINFLNQQQRVKQRRTTRTTQILIPQTTKIEQTTVNIGYIPLTDCAPLIIAREQGFFAKYGIEQVNLCPESSWDAIADRIVSGKLTAAQMVGGLPLALTMGMNGQPSTPISVPLVLSRNGNAITLSTELYHQGVRTLQDLKAAIGDRQPKITLDRISKVYPTIDGPASILDGIDLTVAEGEFICPIGHSGCGKSTLLNMVSGFNTPTSGSVKLQDRLITEPGPDRMMVFQNYCLLPWLTAYDNIYLAVDSVYPDRTEVQKKEIVCEHIEMVGLTEAAHKKPTQLSGGMKQRVAIARALAIKPQVLILDEPFGALDAIAKEELQDELLEIWRTHQVTVLMITHDIDEALYLADRHDPISIETRS